MWARLCSDVRPKTTRSFRLFLAHRPSVSLAEVCPSSSVASASCPLVTAGQVIPASGMSFMSWLRVPHRPSQPSCTYWPCQVVTGSLISNFVCGAKTPWTSQKDTFPTGSGSLTTFAEVTLPGASGTWVKFLCTREAQDITGLIGPALVLAEAGTLTPSSTVAISGTASPMRDSSCSRRFTGSSLLRDRFRGAATREEHFLHLVTPDAKQHRGRAAQRRPGSRADRRCRPGRSQND